MVGAWLAKTGNPYKYGWKEKGGPIPPGVWWVRLSFAAVKWSASWDGEWGPLTLHLAPSLLTKTYGRYKHLGDFSLHSYDTAAGWRYSHGCIRTSQGAVWTIFKELTLHDNKMPVYVNYSSHPEFWPMRYGYDVSRA
jgi:hypothetical protein